MTKSFTTRGLTYDQIKRFQELVVMANNEQLYEMAGYCEQERTNRLLRKQGDLGITLEEKTL